MKRKIRRKTSICVGLLVLTVLVTLSIAKSQVPQSKSMPEPKQSNIKGLLPHGNVKDGLAAFLLCHRQRFKLGEPVPLSYGIMNIGSGVDTDQVSETRVWWFTTGPIDPGHVTWLEVKGPDEKRIPYQGPVPAWRNLSTAVNTNSVLLRPRQFVGNILPDFRYGFELTKPGVYKVRWGYNPLWKGGPWIGKLISNEVQFEIVK